jgi:hypothetical protein
MLRRGVRERRQLLEETGVHVFLREPVEQLLHSAAVSCSRRPHADRAAVPQTHVELLRDRVCTPASELLTSGDEPSGDSGVEQSRAFVGMRDLNECHRTLGERLPEQIGGAVFGDHPVHVGARNRDGLPRLELRADRRSAIRSAGGQTDDRHPVG